MRSRPRCRCTGGPHRPHRRRTSHRRSRPRSAPRPGHRDGWPPRPLPYRGPAVRPRPPATAGAAAGAGLNARPPRRCSSSCSLPAPSAAPAPSERRPGGSPGDRNTPPPARTDLPAGHEAGHQIAWQQRLLRLELVSQLVMIAAAAPLCGHSLTCTNKPKITNYSCRISDGMLAVATSLGTPPAEVEEARAGRRHPAEVAWAALDKQSGWLLVIDNVDD